MKRMMTTIYDYNTRAQPLGILLMIFKFHNKNAHDKIKCYNNMIFFKLLGLHNTFKRVLLIQIMTVFTELIISSSA